MIKRTYPYKSKKTGHVYMFYFNHEDQRYHCDESGAALRLSSLRRLYEFVDAREKKWAKYRTYTNINGFTIKERIL
jgi:hypothetical protein